MPVNRKRIVKAIINDLETFESNADQFVVTAESLVSSYRVERAVKVTEIDLAYYQSEPIKLPVIYGEEFLYKAYVVTKQGRQSVVSEFTKTISKTITAPFEFNVSNRKTSLKVEALFDAGITDIERVEYVIKSTAQTLDINSVPTHVTYNNEPLVIPLEPGETIYLYGRRVDSYGNMSSWIGLSGNPFTSASTLNKTDVGLNLVDNTADASKPVSLAQATAISSAEATAIETSVKSSSTNLLRNSGFNILGALEPFRSDQSASSVVIYDSSGSEQSVARILCNDTNYHYIGQKIYLPVKLSRATKFSLSFELISSYIAGMENIQVGVFAWNTDVPYTTIASGNGLTSGYSGKVLWKENGSGDTDLGTIPNVYTSLDAYKKFENFEVPAETKIIYVQFRFRATSAGNAISNMIDRIMLNEGSKSVAWKQHPEDDIENRQVGLASHIVNQLFEIDANNKIKLKKNIYVYDTVGQQDILLVDAINGLARAVGGDIAITGNASDTAEGYKSYDDQAT